MNWMYLYNNHLSWVGSESPPELWVACWCNEYPLAEAKKGRYVTSLLCWIHKCREQGLGQTPRCFAQHEVNIYYFMSSRLSTYRNVHPQKLRWKSKLDGLHIHIISSLDVPNRIYHKGYTTKVGPIALKRLGNDHHSDLWDAPGSGEDVDAGVGEA